MKAFFESNPARVGHIAQLELENFIFVFNILTVMCAGMLQPPFPVENLGKAEKKWEKSGKAWLWTVKGR